MKSIKLCVIAVVIGLPLLLTACGDPAPLSSDPVTIGPDDSNSPTS